MNKKTLLFGIIIILAMAVFAVSIKAADNSGIDPGVDVLEIKINGDTVTDNATISTSVERNQNLDISVKLRALVNNSNVDVTAYISGYDNNNNPDERISDVKTYENMESNVEYNAKLSIKLPDIMDQADYTLRILVATRDSDTKSFNYNLKIDAPTHELAIKDIILNPADSIKAGRSLIANVRIKNIGNKTENDIKVKTEIESLDGVQATYYMDNLESDISKTSEDMLLRIPAETKPGFYTIKATVYYNNDHETVSKTADFQILPSDVAAPTTPSTPVIPTPNGTATPATPADQNNVLINFDSNTKVLTRGEGGAIYTITVSNNGATAKSFVFDAAGVDWANLKLSPGNMLVVNPGESKAVYIYVSANEETAVGEHAFSVNVKSGNTVMGTVNFNADVVEAQSAVKSGTLNAVLMYLLIALVIVAVLVLIVFAVTRMNKKGGSKESKEPGFDMGQSYY